VLEARVAGLQANRLIVAGIETREQRMLAAQAGFGFAQGSAIRPAYDPPSIRTPQTLPPRDAAEAPIDDTLS
jgi:EAL domain-containing protein (putative c-di-GMP-specific phosphodiesterase class I)